MGNSASSASSSIPPVIPIDPASLASSSGPPVISIEPQLRQLLTACCTGDFNLINANPDILLYTTPHKNNCLHIAAMLGHDEFAQRVWSRAPSLFSGINDDGETPLIAALMAANLSLASNIFTSASNHMQQHDDLEVGRPFNRMLLKVDRRGESALHHAIRNGFTILALDLLETEPRLSELVSNTLESPMYMAARRGCSQVVALLLEIPSSADSGPVDKSAMHASLADSGPVDGSAMHASSADSGPVHGSAMQSSSAYSGSVNGSAMHAAVRFNHQDIVKRLLMGRPQLAYCKDARGNTPLHEAVGNKNIDLVTVFLEHDPNLAYIKNGKTERTPFIMAARSGFVLIAEVIMNKCPDSVYTPNKDEYNALHEAIICEQPDFIDYILRTPQLHRLINQANNIGSLPIHLAADKCDPKLLRSLLSHAEQDYTAVNVMNENAVSIVFGKHDLWNTLKWNESFTLLSNEIPSSIIHTSSTHTKNEMNKQAIKEVKSLTAKYTSNTSLVAALLATITFAAAFTLPGGFSTDPSDAGQPLFARKVAFKVFLISDTIAMCSSLSVAFLCILATRDDLDYLLNYRKKTRVLMWCAYMATTLAFGTGLFTVIAPNNLWLAILILVLCSILPFLSNIISEWPQLMARYRLNGKFRHDLLPNI